MNYKNTINILILFCQFIFADCNYKLENIYFNNELARYYLSTSDLDEAYSNINIYQFRIISENCAFPNTIYLNYSLELYSPQLGFTSTEKIYEGTSKITLTSPIIYFNNLDLGLESQFNSNGYITNKNYIGPNIFDNPQASKMIEYIASTGKLPQGRLIFKFNLLDSYNDINSLDSYIHILEISDPFVLELISPGGNIHEIDYSYIFSNHPVFQWQSDQCDKCSYGIRICEYNSDNHKSLASAINDIAHIPLEPDKEYYDIGHNVNFFQYPNYGVRQLEIGKSYVWNIQRKFESTNETINQFSPIFVFKIEESNNISIKEKPINDKNLIKTFIGSKKYNSLFEINGQLYGYTFSNSEIFINDKKASEQEIQELQKTLEMGRIKIMEIEIK